MNILKKKLKPKHTKPKKGVKSSRIKNQMRKLNAQNNSQTKKYDYHKYLVFILLLVILSNAAYYTFSHFEGPSMYGDDTVYVSMAASVLQGTFRTNSFIFSTRLVEAYTIAFFYYLMGVNNLSSSMWNIISYLGIILVTFLIVRFLYDDKAALVSAFVISIFPLVTKFAVNVGEDIPLAFVGSLAILLLLYAKRYDKRIYWFFSGALLFVTWLISVEGAVIIEFVFLYLLIEIVRKKIKINRKSLFFIIGFIVILLLTFLYSYLNSGHTFNTIITNFCFYSSVGTTACGHSTIPTTNNQLSFYINSMFQYHFVNSFLTNKNPFSYFYNNVFKFKGPTDFGLYFYFVMIFGISLVAIRDKKSYFFLFWFVIMFALLEFGPMHVGIKTNPLGIVYILTYRLNRFLLPLVVPISAIIGIGISKLIDFKKYKLPISLSMVSLAIIVLIMLFVSNYNISSFWYYWQSYPRSLIVPAAVYMRNIVPLNSSTMIYFEGLNSGGGNIAYSGSAFSTYYGKPNAQNIQNIGPDIKCIHIKPRSYIVWSGKPKCNNWKNVYNIQDKEYIPKYIISQEKEQLPYIPTNIYYAT